MKNQNHKNCQKETSKEFWRLQVDAWADSGLSQAAYCRQYDLKHSTFSYWKRKLFRKNLPIEFVQISEESFKSSPSALFQEACSPCLRLTVSSQFTIEIPDGFAHETLKKTLMVLKEM